MELLTTHVGADFDALASMLAARRLFPEAQLFFPGSREESVRRMLDSGELDLRFAEMRQRDVSAGELRRLILCDSRQRERIGVVAAWIDCRPDLEVLAFDHHPDSPSDVPVSGGRVDPAAGSTSTLLVETLRERGVEVTADEASVLLMGIYEDTGSLTYATTGPRDLAAVEWLLGRGGRPGGGAALRAAPPRRGAAGRAPPHGPAPWRCTASTATAWGWWRSSSGATSTSWRRWSAAAWSSSSCRSSSPCSARPSA